MHESRCQFGGRDTLSQTRGQRRRSHTEPKKGRLPVKLLVSCFPFQLISKITQIGCYSSSGNTTSFILYVILIPNGQLLTVYTPFFLVLLPPLRPAATRCSWVMVWNPLRLLCGALPPFRAMARRSSSVRLAKPPLSLGIVRLLNCIHKLHGYLRHYGVAVGFELSSSVQPFGKPIIHPAKLGCNLMPVVAPAKAFTVLWLCRLLLGS